MKFGYLGINYKNASLDVRDHISFTENLKIDYMQSAEALGISQCLVLATCNRNEVFFFYEEEEQRQDMARLYQDMFPEVELADILQEKSQDQALTYLFNIASGLESAVLGEDQILGQLKDALMLSKALGYSGKELHRVVENAMSCAKDLKTRYRISEIPISVSYIGIKETERLCGFAGKDVLLIGSGATATLALKYVVEYGAAGITMCSRNPAHARAVMEEYPQLKVVLYEDRYRELEGKDIVISATSSPRFTIEADKCSITEPVTFLDLAAPRDIDPALAESELVQLINLDTLEQISRDNQQERVRLTEKCRDDIEKAVSETREWLFESRVDPTIQSLHSRCDQITEESFEYLNRKLTLSNREQKILKKILKASLKKMIREPIIELKHLETTESQDRYVDMVNTLFHLK